MITTIHAYPVKELSLAENAEENSADVPDNTRGILETKSKRGRRFGEN